MRTAFVSFVADLTIRCRDLCSDEPGHQSGRVTGSGAVLTVAIYVCLSARTCGYSLHARPKKNRKLKGRFDYGRLKHLGQGAKP